MFKSQFATAIFLTALVSAANADPYVGLGYGGRPKAINGSIGEQFTPTLGAEFDYINEGQQPNGIPNDNEVLTLDVIGTLPVYKSLSIYAKGGIADMRQTPELPWSGFNGYNIGVGVKYSLGYSVSVFAEINELHTQQAIGLYENFTDGSAGIQYQF
ncbi:MAG: hypothetical protein ACYC4K_06180 [Thiobacillus sp.]